MSLHFIYSKKEAVPYADPSEVCHFLSSVFLHLLHQTHVHGEVLCKNGV